MVILGLILLFFCGGGVAILCCLLPILKLLTAISNGVNNNE